MKAKRHWVRRRAFLLWAALMLWASAPVGQAWASPVAKAEQEREAAQAEGQKAREEAEALEQKQGDAGRQARELGDELTRLLTLSNLLKSDMKELDQQIGTADQEYEAAKKEQERRYGMLKKRIRFLYEEGDITYLDILLKARNIGDVVDQTEYFDQLYRYDKNQLVQYEKVKAEVLMRKRGLEEKQSEMEAMEQEYEVQQADIRTLIRTKEQETADFGIQLAAARERAAKSADQVRKKNEEIRRLRAEEARKKEEARKREEARLREEAGIRSEAEAGGRAAGVQTDHGAGQTHTAGQEPMSGQGTEPGIRQPLKSAGGTAFGRSIADYGLQFVGNPYVWGGTSLTSGADCSGFTQSVYRHFGVDIPRTSAEQAWFGKEIPYEDMEPGDLVCYSGHVAMYIGNGQIVHASSRKEGIKVGNDPAYRTIVSIRRPWQ
ncbi:NlpC/P60 family protein [Enterocloster sp. OA13]|uniref:C40 family peptidase n=1 Tax=Enterocloster sp. OA13 TaxID=2914161 RepID=UPI00046FB3AE|nr:NlpC/P60 family protein [Enterocloster sp. OA13]